MARDAEALGASYERSLPRAGRRRDGVFYTPREVTRFLVDATLGPALAGRDPGALRVIDPACGSGALLLAACDRLVAAGLDPAAAVGRLHGVDLDGDAVEVARRSLALQVGLRPPALDVQLRRADALHDDPALRPGGFDVVLGNPPYVRGERLAARKPALKARFATFDPSADLYVYFFERGLELLAPGGRLGFVVADKWLRAGYAARLRALLADACDVELVVDLGHAPVFEGADAFPSIVVLRRRDGPADPARAVTAARLPRSALGGPLADAVADHGVAIPQRRLGAAPWSLEPPPIEALLARLRAVGTPLAEVVGARPLRGVLTGCNAAFVVDAATRDRLVAEDPRSAEVLRPMLRGRDVGPWAATSERFLLTVASSADVAWPWARAGSEAKARATFAATFPAVHRHLSAHEAALRPRADQGRWWWELRSCTWWAAFDGPKLAWTDITWRPSFAAVGPGVVANNTVYLLPGRHPWAMAVLNSPLLWWFLGRTAQRGKDEALRLFTDLVAAVPIATPGPGAERRAGELVEEATALAAGARDAAVDARIGGIERELAEVVLDAFRLTAEERALVRRTAVARTPG